MLLELVQPLGCRRAVGAGRRAVGAAPLAAPDVEVRLDVVGNEFDELKRLVDGSLGLVVGQVVEEYLGLLPGQRRHPCGQVLLCRLRRLHSLVQGWPQ